MYNVTCIFALSYCSARCDSCNCIFLSPPSGVIAVAGGSSGMFIGGYIIKRFNLKVRGIIRFTVGLNAISLVLGLVFLVRCDSVDFAGVSVTYDGRSMSGCVLHVTIK